MVASGRSRRRARRGGGQPLYALPEAVAAVARSPCKFRETVEVAVRLGVDPNTPTDVRARSPAPRPRWQGQDGARGRLRREAEGSAGRRCGSRRRRRMSTAYRGELAGLRRHGGDAGHDGRSASWEDPRPPRGDAEPEDGTSPRLGRGRREIKAGKVEYRVDKTASSTRPSARSRSARDKSSKRPGLIDSVMKRGRRRPGQVRQAIALSSHMGPGVRVDLNSVEAQRKEHHEQPEADAGGRPAQGVRKSQHAIMVDFRG